MLIAVLTDPGVGGTFLTWSLHYLAGHKKYYHARTDQWIDLPMNPLTDKNSHGFLPNQPVTLDLFNLLHSKLQNARSDQFHSIYFHNFDLATTSLDSDTATAISNLSSEKIIVLTVSDQHHLYHCSYNMRCDTKASWIDPTQRINNSDAAFDDFIQYFFKKSLSEWKSMGLSNVWDVREFLALNLNPADVVSILPNINLSSNHYLLNTAELYNTFDATVDSMFEYLEIKIDSERKNTWNSIYYKWRQVHYNRMLFSWYFHQIINNIISGNNFDLTRFNLDIVQEAAIQHELIYKHNLNLKTWQLEKFTNTKQLFQLLEPNIHNLSSSKIKSIAAQ